MTRHAVVHLDFVSRDPDATRRFYEQAFGWTFIRPPGLDYTFVEPPEPPGGGLRAPAEGEPTGTLSFVLVDRLEEALARCEAAGARVVQPPTEAPGGRLAVVEAPGGVRQGLWQDVS